MTADNGVITSPGYPQNYANSLVCQYLITVGVNRKIVVDFKFLKTEQNFDRIEIYDGNNYGTHLLGNFSGDSRPPPIISSTNNILIKFRTDRSDTRTGFELQYHTVPAKSKINKTIMVN